MATNDDDDWDAPVKKPKRSKKEKRNVCIVHFDDIPLSNFIPVTDDTLKKLKDVKVKRQKQPHASSSRMTAQCEMLKE